LYNAIENLKPEEILIYLRKSRADDPLMSVEEVLSKHESMLDEWADRNLPSPIPEENRFREVISGGESIADRPAFQKVLKLMESPNIRAVLVVEIARLGRPDTEEIGRITKMFRYTGCLVITPMMTFDITNEYERDMFERELKRGQEYLEYTKKRLRAGRELSVKSGNCVLSRGLYGYDKTIVIVDKRRCPTLTINEEQANIVRMIFNAYVNENVGTQVIANRLNDLQIKSPRGNLWTADSIRTVLENPHYTGMVRWNQRKAVLVVKDGEFRKTRPLNTDDDIIFTKGKHEAIISEELFDAAQEKRRRSHRTRGNRELRNPFASILFCECGKAMSYRFDARAERSDSVPRLVCNQQHLCGNGSCSVDEIVEFVVNLLKQKIEEFEIEATRGDDNSTKLHEKLIKSLEKKLTDLEAKELSLWESQIDPAAKMPPHIFQALTNKLQKEREETETALDNARKAAAKPKNYEKLRITFQTTLDALLDDSVSVSEKNRLLKLCIERIEYHRDAPQKRLGKGSGKGYLFAPIKLDVKLNI
jgi:DNA invertase Pin-like site-specific DNA recombinase